MPLDEAGEWIEYRFNFDANAIPADGRYALGVIATGSFGSSMAYIPRKLGAVDRLFGSVWWMDYGTMAIYGSHATIHLTAIVKEIG